MQVVNRIITLKSKRYPDSYADSHHTYKINVTKCESAELPNAEWSRFLVREGPEGTIVLESVRYRNRYVDAHHSGEVRLTHSPSPPVGEEWARWRMIYKGGYDIALESDRYRGSYLDAHHSGTAHVTEGSSDDTWAQWTIGIGPSPGIGDGYKVIATLSNDLDTIATYHDVKYTVGVSVAEGSSTVLTDSLSNEMSTNFSAGPLSLDGKEIISFPLSLDGEEIISFSSDWAISFSVTWQDTSILEMARVDVLPKSKTVVSQLQGTYGPLQVNSTQLKFDSESI